VKTKPEGAQVRILNIRPRFYEGMELESGKYDVEVSAKGYDTKKILIILKAGEDKTINIQLSKLLDSLTNSLGMNFIGISPGSFMMGSPDDESKGVGDEKEHQVTLTKKFYMQATEATVGHFGQFIDETGYRTRAETTDGYCYITRCGRWQRKKGSNWENPGSGKSAESIITDYHPVTCVTWNDVQAFIEWLNNKEGKTYGLPTEAEWEYACRAGTNTPFSFGRCLSTDQANYGGVGQHFSECQSGLPP
jgi:formylglycine-generating enzyme required for sulfatase activity